MLLNNRGLGRENCAYGKVRIWRPPFPTFPCDLDKNYVGSINLVLPKFQSQGANAPIASLLSHGAA